jgi:WD40 repeat protein
VGERSPHTSKLIGHRQEVCGLQWSPDHQFLASGGNDNRLLIWDVNSTRPLYKYTDHAAAVKAIAWSPHQVRTMSQLINDMLTPRTHTTHTAHHTHDA